MTGGFLLEHFWWGSVFIVNVPIVIGAIVAGHFLVPDVAQPASAPSRLVGAGAVDRRARWRWSGRHHRGAEQRLDRAAPILAGFAVAVLALGGLRVRGSGGSSTRCSTSASSRNPRFTAASVTVTLVFFALFGFIFLATQYLQFVLGYSAFAGRCPHPAVRAALMVDRRAAVVEVVEWFGTKRVVVTGMLIVRGRAAWSPSTSTVTSATRG